MFFCYISGELYGGCKCIGANGPECGVFLPQGVRIRNNRVKCNFKEMRMTTTDTNKRKVNPLKASKRKGGN